MPLNRNDAIVVKEALAELERKAMLYAKERDPKITFIGTNTPVIQRDIPEEVQRQKGLSDAELLEAGELRQQLAAMIAGIDYENDSPAVVAQKCQEITDFIRTFPWHAPRGGTGNALNTFKLALRGTQASIDRGPMTINTVTKEATPAPVEVVKPVEAVKPAVHSSEAEQLAELKEAARELISIVTDPEVEGAVEHLEGVLQDETTDLRELVEACRNVTEAIKESPDYAPPARPKKNRDPDALPEVKKINPLGNAVFRVDKAIAQAEQSMLANRSGSSQRSSGSSAGSANAQEVAKQMEERVKAGHALTDHASHKNK